MTGVVVIGVGNPYRGDDALGLAVAQRVRARAPGVEVVECEQEPTRLLDAWAGAELAIVVDACASASPPGTVHRFEPGGEERVPARVFRSSTHAFGVADAVELARALGRLPARVVVYGVEGESFAAGTGLSAAAARAADEVAAAIVAELKGETR